MVRRLAKFVAVAALVALPSAVQAQARCVGIGSCTINPSASLTIPQLVVLELASAAITLNTPIFTTDSLNNQLTETTFGGLNVRANHPWTLNVSAAAATWTYTPAGGAVGGARDRADLEFQAGGCGGTWVAMGAGAAAVATGVVTNGAPASVCFRTNFPNDYASVKNRPGTYTLALTLTLAAN